MRPLPRVIPLSFAAALSLAAARPAPEGAEIEINTGTARSEIDVIDVNPTYRYRTAGVFGHVMVRQRAESGLTIAAQLSGEGALIVGNAQLAPTDADDWTGPRYELGQGTAYGGGGARVGYHGRFIGGEAGAVLVRDNAHDHALRPSAEGWIGVPKLAYAWASYNTGPTIATPLFNQPFVGVGHRSDYVSVWAGAHVISRLEVPPDELAPYSMGAALEVNPGVRLGLDYAEGRRSRSQAQPDSRLMMVVHVERRERDEAVW